MGNSSSLWYSKNHRKVLVLSFEDYYQSSKIFNPELSEYLTGLKLDFHAHVGFSMEKIEYNDLQLRLTVYYSNPVSFS